VKSWWVWMGVLSVTIAMPSDSARAQDEDGIIDAGPVRVEPLNPVNNNQPIRFGSGVALDGNVLVVGAPEEDSSTEPTDFDTGAVYIFEREGLIWTEPQKLRAPTEIAFEGFGTSVDVALGDQGEDYLIVGAPGLGGTAYLFSRTGSTWDFEVAFTPLTPDAGDLFGQSVAIDYFEPTSSPSGDKVFIAAVGAPQNSDPMGTGSLEGSVSILQRSGGSPTWSITQEFFGDNGDELGRSLAMARDFIVAGTEGFDGGGANAGGARVYRSGNFGGTAFVYGEESLLQPSNPEVGQGLGRSVAASNDPGFLPTAAIGSELSDEGIFNGGRVLIFDISPPGGPTTESASLLPPDVVQGALFGTSVALSSGLLAVGAPGVDSDGTVYIFEQGATIETWDLLGPLTIPDVPPVGSCDGGEAAALDGLTLAVGCPASSDPDNEGVFLYFEDPIFVDGFESGDVSAWTSAVP